MADTNQSGPGSPAGANKAPTANEAAPEQLSPFQSVVVVTAGWRQAAASQVQRQRIETRDLSEGVTAGDVLSGKGASGPGSLDDGGTRPAAGADGGMAESMSEKMKLDQIIGKMPPPF